MDSFMDDLYDDETLVNLCRTLYKFDLKDPNMRLRVSFPETDNSKHCGDILMVVELYINQPIKKQKQRCRLFHISLHPKLPKYYYSSRRSRSACGYYESSGDDEGDRSGPLHYKIYTLQWCNGKGIGKSMREDERPYKPLLPHKGNGYMFEHDEQPFYLLNRERFDLDATTLADLNTMHNIIYNHFVRCWNTHVVHAPDVKRWSSSVKAKTARRKSTSKKLLSKRKTRSRYFAPNNFLTTTPRDHSA
jgi:hypothetical protein